MSAMQGTRFAVVEVLGEVGLVEQVQIPNLGAFCADDSEEMPSGHFKGLCISWLDGEAAEADQFVAGGLQ